MGGHYLEKELFQRVREDPSIFEFLQRGSLDGIWYWDLENPEHEWMSPRFWEVLGQDPTTKRHLASEWQDLIHPEDLARATDNAHRHFEDPSVPYDQVVRYRHADGSTVWIRCRGIAIRDETGRPVRMLGAHNALTEVFRVRDSLDAKEQLLSQVLNASIDGIMVFRSLRDDAGAIVDFEWIVTNDRACEIVGFSREQLLGHRLLDRMPGNKEAGLFDRYVQVVEHGEPLRLEFHYDHEGIQEWFQTRTVKLGDGFVVTFSVITQLKEYQLQLERKVEAEVQRRQEQEELLVQQSRLASMGEMLGMLAHQWRQPLNVVSMALGTVELMADRGALEPEKVRELTEKGQAQLDYMSRTIDDFRCYFDRGASGSGEFDATAAVQEGLALCSHQLERHHIRTTVRLDQARLVGPAHQFKQILLVLIRNAKDAIQRARTEGALGEDELGEITVTLELEPSELVLTIADTGTGIDPEIRERIFEPYFTTKHASVGTGLGLYMVQTILDRYLRGTISLDNGVRGAVCTVRFLRA